MIMDNKRIEEMQAKIDALQKELSTIKRRECKKELPVTERVKTLEDAIEELGKDNELVKAYESVKGCIGLGKDVIAYMKLRIIASALNEGWRPNFIEDEKRYYPWFQILSKEKYEEQSEEWKKRHKLGLFGGHSSHGEGCGLACADSVNAGSDSLSHGSALLAMKTRELAEYIGNQFIDIWVDYVYTEWHTEERAPRRGDTE